MPKARSTCTRCSMRRQKCDRQKPCSRCVSNKEAHLCTTEWLDGYNPRVHRQYPAKTPSNLCACRDTSISGPNGVRQWSHTSVSEHGLPTRLSEKGSNPRCSLSNHVSPDSEIRPQEPTPSSDNLDFVTYGRSEFTDVSVGAILASKDAYSGEKTVQGKTLGREVVPNAEGEPNGFSPAARAVEASHLQSLLPGRNQVFQMVDYHERQMLSWSGGIYHAPGFRKELYAAYGQANELELQSHDWRWTAVLFSIISASIISSPETLSATWGFSLSDKVRLAKQWGNATVACLQLGDYASKYHIYSIQAILNLHAAEHLVGSAKIWSVYHSGALTIARGLGLHRLAAHPEDGISGLSEEQKQNLIHREIGRRIWSALCSQDWLCSTSQGLYNIQKKHFTSIKPGYYNKDTMTPVMDGTPTFSHLGNYTNEIAYLVICYHDDMLEAQDLATKYEVVLKHDGKIRALATDRMPGFMSHRTPYDSSWPPWVAWVRHMVQASWAHKIIMIHQTFLSRSFKQPQYTYSRWACCNAAKIIIEELCHERGPEEPQWWVTQAMLVTAGMCLALDIYHRASRDPETREHIALFDKAMLTLEGWPTSSIATHGIRLLNSLLHEYHKKNGDCGPTSAPSGLPDIPDPTTLAADATSVPETRQSQPSFSDTTAPTDSWPSGEIDFDITEFVDLMDTFPLETGLDNNIFESMFSLTTSQYS